LPKVKNELTQMGAHPQAAPSWNGGRVAATSAKALAVALLGLAFFLAPTLQGISLVADQGVGGSSATRAADEVAAREADRLTQG
jgi:hypothetical protein